MLSTLNRFGYPQIFRELYWAHLTQWANGHRLSFKREIILLIIKTGLTATLLSAGLVRKFFDSAQKR